MRRIPRGQSRHLAATGRKGRCDPLDDGCDRRSRTIFFSPDGTGSLFGRSATAAASTLSRPSPVRPRGIVPEGGGLASRPDGKVDCGTGWAPSAGEGLADGGEPAPTSWAPAVGRRSASLLNRPSRGIRYGRRTVGTACSSAGRATRTPLPQPSPIGTAGSHGRGRTTTPHRRRGRTACAGPRHSSSSHVGSRIGASCLLLLWAMRGTSGTTATLAQRLAGDRRAPPARRSEQGSRFAGGRGGSSCLLQLHRDS